MLFRSDAGDREGLRRFTRMTGGLVTSMRACPQPIVAAVDGVCAGAGAILAMASDLRLGTSRSKVAFLFVRVGLSGADMGACAILPRIIGQGRASELLYTGRFMDGVEAERWGFYNRLVAADSLLDEARALARSLADGPAIAHATTKQCLHLEWNMGVDAAVAAEAEAGRVHGDRGFRARLPGVRRQRAGDLQRGLTCPPPSSIASCWIACRLAKRGRGSNGRACPIRSIRRS